MANTNLANAKTAKKDEFYTQLEDINKELKYYREHFRGTTASIFEVRRYFATVMTLVSLTSSPTLLITLSS